MNAALFAFVAYVPQPPPSVQVKSAFPHALQIGKLCRTTRWFRDIGYTLPIPSGDAEFDAQWAVESADREFTQALVSRREARAALLALRALGCGTISHDRRQWTALLGPRPKGRSEREQHEQDIRAQLAVLDGVSANLLRQRTFPVQDCRKRVALASIGAALTFAAIVFGFARGAEELLVGEMGPLVLKSLIVSLPLLALLLVISTRALAGSSTSHKALAVVALLSIVSLPSLGAAGAVLANRAFDEATPVVRRVPVLELLEKRNGENKKLRHYAVVPAWNEGEGATRRVRLDEALAKQVVAGSSRLRLTTSPGALDGERLLDLQLEQEAFVR